MKKVKVLVDKYQTSDGTLFDLSQEKLAEIHEKSLQSESILRTKDGEYFQLTDELPNKGDWFYQTYCQVIGKIESINNGTIRTCAYPLHSYILSEYTKKLIKLI